MTTLLYTIEQEWNSEDKLVWSVCIWPFDTEEKASIYVDKLQKTNKLPNATFFYGGDDANNRSFYAGIWGCFPNASSAGRWVDQFVDSLKLPN
jgi:hypothetical protein